MPPQSPVKLGFIAKSERWLPVKGKGSVEDAKFIIKPNYIYTNFCIATACFIAEACMAAAANIPFQVLHRYLACHGIQIKWSTGNHH